MADPAIGTVTNKPAAGSLPLQGIKVQKPLKDPKDFDENELERVLENTYRILHDGELSSETKVTLREDIVVNGRNDAVDFAIEATGIFPNIQVKDHTRYVNPGLKRQLRDAFINSRIYEAIMTYENTNPAMKISKPVEFYGISKHEGISDEANLLTGQWQEYAKKGSYLNTRLRYMPDLSLKSTYYGVEPLAYSQSDNRSRRTAVTGLDIKNAGASWMFANGCFLSTTVDHSGREYRSLEKMDGGNGQIGSMSRTDIRTDIVVPNYAFDWAGHSWNKVTGRKLSMFDTSNITESFVLKYLYSKINNSWVIPTRNNYSLLGASHRVEAFTTFGDLIGAGPIIEQENGHVARFVDAWHEYSRTMVGGKGVFNAEGDGRKFRIEGSYLAGTYGMDIASGPLSGTMGSATQVQDPPVGSTESGDAVPQREHYDNTDSRGRIELLLKKNIGKLNMLSLSFDGHLWQSQRYEEQMTLDWGMKTSIANTADLALNFTRQRNYLPEIASYSKGDDISYRASLGISYNFVNALVRRVYDMDSRIGASMDFNAFSQWGHNEGSNISGVNLAFNFFTNAFLGNTRKEEVNRYVSPARFMLITHESPANADLMASYFEEKYREAAEYGTLNDDGWMIRKCTPEERKKILGKIKEMNEIKAKKKVEDAKKKEEAKKAAEAKKAEDARIIEENKKADEAQKTEPAAEVK